VSDIKTNKDGTNILFIFDTCYFTLEPPSLNNVTSLGNHLSKTQSDACLH